jgi:hypothetical protein
MRQASENPAPTGQQRAAGLRAAPPRATREPTVRVCEQYRPRPHRRRFAERRVDSCQIHVHSRAASRSCMGGRDVERAHVSRVLSLASARWPTRRACRPQGVWPLDERLKLATASRLVSLTTPARSGGLRAVQVPGRQSHPLDDSQSRSPIYNLLIDGGADSGEVAHVRLGSAPIVNRSDPPAAMSPWAIHARSSAMPLSVTPCT